MQLPERYWEGRYWEGLTPESLDAVPLESAGPEVAEGMPHDDDAQMIKEAIDLCKKYIAQKQEERVIDLGHLDLKRVDETSVGHDKTTNEEVDSKESAVSHYYITIQDAPLSPTDVVKLRSITSSSRWSNDIKPNLPNSSTASNNGENEGDTSSMDILSGQGKLVCLLWHYSVFLGARDALEVDPGRLSFEVEMIRVPHSLDNETDGGWSLVVLNEKDMSGTTTTLFRPVGGDDET